jgi:plastocyanin
MRRHHLALLVVSALVLSACPAVDAAMRDAEPYECPPAECDPPEPVGEGGHLVVEAGEFFFEIIEESVAEGAIEITLINVGQAEHDFAIDQAFSGERVPMDGFADPGETVEGAMELFAGQYTYYCTFPGHREAGMFGTLDVPIELEDIPEADDPDAAEEGVAPEEDEETDEDDDEDEDEDDA